MLVPNSYPDDTSMLVDRARRGEGLANYETRRMRNDGKIIDVAISMSPLRNDTGTISGASVIARDVTEEKASRISLQRANHSLVLLDRANYVLVHLKDERALLTDICRLVKETGGYPLVAVAYGDGNAAKSVRWIAHVGEAAGLFDADERADGQVGLERNPAWRAICERRMALINNIAIDVSLGRWREAMLQRSFLAAVGLPLLQPDGTAMGALVVYANATDAFGESAIVDLSVIAENLALGIRTLQMRLAHEQDVIEQKKFADQLGQSLEATIGAVAATIDMRDPYTADHQQRVSHLAPAIASAMGLPPLTITGIRLASTIHDIGKICVPLEILSRPGALTKDEFALVKVHVAAGYDILKNIAFPWPVADIVMQHHERLDGSGYPQNLAADQILPEAKILAVADVVEAMCSHRPYRAARGIDAALDEITKNRGKLYDPQAVDACLGLFRGGGFAF